MATNTKDNLTTTDAELATVTRYTSSADIITADKERAETLDKLGSEDGKKRKLITKISWVITGLLLLSYFIYWIVIYNDSNVNIVTQIEYKHIESIDIPVFMLKNTNNYTESTIYGVNCAGVNGLITPDITIDLATVFTTVTDDDDTYDVLDALDSVFISQIDELYSDKWVLIDGTQYSGSLYDAWGETITAILVPPDKSTLDENYGDCRITSSFSDIFLVNVFTQWMDYGWNELFGDGSFDMELLWIGASNQGFWLETITRENFLDKKMFDTSLLTLTWIGFARETTVNFEKITKKDKTKEPVKSDTYLLYEYGFDQLNELNYFAFIENGTWEYDISYTNQIFINAHKDEIETIYVTDLLYSWLDIPSSVGGMYSTLTGIFALILTYFFFGFSIFNKIQWDGYAPHERMDDNEETKTELHLANKQYVTKEVVEAMLEIQKQELMKEFEKKLRESGRFTD